jgi:catalase
VGEFVKDHYRHCKAIFAIGASWSLLDEAGIGKLAASGPPPQGIVGGEYSKGTVASFVKAVAAHRHPERETDPPVI